MSFIKMESVMWQYLTVNVSISEKFDAKSNSDKSTTTISIQLTMKQ